jgi:hypothetical protein
MERECEREKFVWERKFFAKAFFTSIDFLAVLFFLSITHSSPSLTIQKEKQRNHLHTQSKNTQLHAFVWCYKYVFCLFFSRACDLFCAEDSRVMLWLNVWSVREENNSPYIMYSLEAIIYLWIFFIQTHNDTLVFQFFQKSFHEKVFMLSYWSNLFPFPWPHMEITSCLKMSHRAEGGERRREKSSFPKVTFCMNVVREPFFRVVLGQRFHFDLIFKADVGEKLGKIRIRAVAGKIETFNCIITFDISPSIPFRSPPLSQSIDEKRERRRKRTTTHERKFPSR